MNYSIVYSSKTGNTKMLAESIKEVVDTKKCSYFGTPLKEATQADLIFVGFWTDKGTCDETIKAFLHGLKDRDIFLFGTAGFGSDPFYYERILQNVSKNIDTSNTIIGSYMCQGKMPSTVLARYEKMLQANPGDEKLLAFIHNYEGALAHPNKDDLNKLRQLVSSTMNQYNRSKKY